MKNVFLSIITVVLTFSLFAQTQEKNWNIIVAFNPDLSISQGEEIQSLSQQVEGFASLQESYQFQLKKTYAFTESDLVRMEKAALKVSNDAGAIKNLRNVFDLIQPDLNDAAVKDLERKLNALSDVRYVELVSTHLIQPPYDIPPATPDYVSQQDYLDADPGVNMHYAWDLDLNGQNIRVRDVEYGFNKAHEEFNDNDRVFLAPGYTLNAALTEDFTEHGTGTFGVLFGQEGDYGVTGMAHGAEEVILYSEYTEEYGYNRAYAVSLAINDSEEGDVILYEMQTGGANQTGNDPAYVPAEYSQSVWDLTNAASDLGIIIVAAAGNGAQNLDAPEYQDYMDRGNSGAIIVGAGAPTIKHKRLNFSTYGSRVNVQGWGQSVLSSGYGDFSKIGNDFNQQYTMFSGTSSATPIVASCVVVLQSYYHSITGEYMNSAEMIDLLQTTGHPQVGNENIGPLPNMEAAIEALNVTAGINNSEQFKFKAFPNPTADEVTIVGLENMPNATVELYNTVGDRVVVNQLGDNHKISLEGLAKGIYFLKITHAQNMETIKIIKK